MIFYNYALKTEASLPNAANGDEKVSVVAHGRSPFRRTRMLAHASPKLIDSGRTAHQTPELGPEFTRVTAGEVRP